MSSSKKHSAVFDDVLADIDSDAPAAPRPGTRFLKRSTSIGESLAGEREEKVLHWVDPAQCRMWERHNREYALLTEETCADLIDGIKAQGQQEFPAIVRRLPEGESHAYEVICGARRHFAISWLRANNYPQYKYLIEVRDLTDEEAFRLADIENRDRDDISDFERARDYAAAIDLYYGGKQKAMAARLEVSETWLSRYLQMAKLPGDVVEAFASIREIKEKHARAIKPLLATNGSRLVVLGEARTIRRQQREARAGQGALIDPAAVVARLKTVAARELPKAKRPADAVKTYGHGARGPSVKARRAGRKTVLEVPDLMTRAEVEVALQAFLKDRFGGA